MNKIKSALVALIIAAVMLTTFATIQVHAIQAQQAQEPAVTLTLSQLRMQQHHNETLAAVLYGVPVAHDRALGRAQVYQQLADELERTALVSPSMNRYPVQEPAEAAP